MQKTVPWALAGALLLSLINPSPATEPPLNANAPSPVTFREDFSVNPLARGWEIVGETNLFAWNSTNHHLEVTWDSSKSNSYFRLRLGTIAIAQDDFSVELDLHLHEIGAGVRPEFPGAMQLAFGFQNRRDADDRGFIRGTGADSPNLVEFNFFPDTGFGATVWPLISFSNSVVNYNGNGDFSKFELPVGVTMNIALQYTASNRTVSLAIRTNGVLVGPIVDAPIAVEENGFEVDAFAISSYGEAGQSPNFPGSIFARGAVDNITVTAPPPPIRDARGTRTGGEWRHEVLSLSGWNYVLEASEDLAAWAEVSAAAAGTGDWIKLSSADSPPRPRRFFRVKALRK